MTLKLVDKRKESNYDKNMKLEIKARREVKNRQVGSAWDKGSF